mmetsp:Transcript_5301/g.12029  ORF Transcript_5301/g.12029 Transcript_5301/m.12029 type:complete len:485 (+) Transcript_5301:171-1625(+)|eukprot:CAMPEP_0172312378 /NCGR_PEP_ID=MMETSP1058-20130122/17269_1 /TAXON_ID=83371 /ORGANISM="Detonula confervacea, Strain CCMP 353" /LENGTH=484 /DNA_ID=CAMNT_0013025811 /DNA_START=87 /DNA_END=1541 /DNA_ORIENTATION=+
MDIQPAETAPLVSTPDVNIPPLSDDNTPSSTDDCNNCFPNPNILNPTALETSQWWAENTSIHGMYYMLERGHLKTWKTLAWAVIVLTATGGLVWALIAEMQDFAQYNVDTTTKTMILASLSFPRVTLCNANRGVDATLQNATGITEPRNEEELVAISQPLEDFILHTQFNAKVYESELEIAGVWTPIITPLGQCFSFVTDEKVFVPGISAGLTVYTWLDQSSYPETTHWAGVHVLVTPNSISTNNNHGVAISQQASGTVLVPPGAVSFVAVKMQDFQREEDEPWTDCIPTTLGQQSDDGDSVSSSIEQCRMECIMSATKEKCGCRLIGDNDNSDGHTLYDYCNSTDLVCTSSIGDDDLTLCQTCSIPPCKEQVYSTQYSAGRISQKTIEHLKRTNNTTIDYNEISTNFVAIQINYDSIRYEQTTESKSTSVAQLFSNLGGSFGFFMGISIISIVEVFVELIGLRLVPRLWGKRLLYGIGQKKFN